MKVYDEFNRMMFAAWRDAGEPVPDLEYFAAMDRETYREFVAGFLESMAAMVRPEHLALNKSALEAQFNRIGVTDIDFMGAKICIVPWIHGFALFPRNPTPDLRRLLTVGF